MKKILFCLSLICASIVSAQEKDSVNLEDVVVTGTRQATPLRKLPMTVSVINRDVLTENQRQNILPTLAEQVPGLFVTSRGMMGYGVSGGAAGSISVRGLSAGTGQVLVLIDGHPQYQGIFGHSIGDSYQTMMVERVEVVRGPASMLYGSNAMGGVINIVTRGMKKDGVKTHINLGAGSWGTVQAEASNLFRKGKFSSTVAAQYGRSDNHRPRMGFQQYGGYVKLAYDFNDHWNAFVDFDITHFDGSHPGPVKKPKYEADQWITRGVATIGVEHKYEKFSGTISAYDNFGFHKINDGYEDGIKPQTEFFNSKDALAGVSWFENMNLFQGNTITVGVDYQHIYGRAYYTNRETGKWVTTGSRAIQSTHTHSNEVAGYVDIRQDFTSWLTVDAGVRYDHHSVAGGEWVPQAGIVARPMKNGEIKAVASKGFRNPTTKDLFLYKSANHETLRAERLWNYELAWHHELLNGNLSYGVNLFIIDGDNMIQTVAGKNINTGRVKNQGFEVEGAWRINDHWSLNTNHSYLHMDYHIVGSPEYKGFIGANMRYGKWTATAGLQQLCGLYTEVGKDEQKTNVTLLNATVGYQVLKFMQLWAKGENLLAQKYEINSGYPMPRATFMAGVNLNF